MPRRPIIPARNRTNIEYSLDSAETFEAGAPGVLDADEEFTETGADPASILGFAEHAAKDSDGNDRAILPGKVTVSVAKGSTTFWGTMSAAPVQDDIGKQYGITKDADGIWYVDKAKTGASARVVVEAIDTELDLCEFSVLQANRVLDV